MSGSSRCIVLRDLHHDDERISGLFVPRTRTYILLHRLGLPLLDGCLVLDADDASLHEAAAFMAQYGDTAIVRSDPLRRDSPTIRGGDLWSLTDLRKAADLYLSVGRALLLLEPYERSANEWSFAMMGGLPDHAFVLEIVGPGFDTGHLNRGRLTPHETYSGLSIGPAPRVVSHVPLDRARYAQDLVEAGLGRDPSIARPFPKGILSDVLRYFARVEPTRKGTFVLSGAVLQPGERLVFWDLYDPAQGNR
jgi:hypothetical protein